MNQAPPAANIKFWVIGVASLFLLIVAILLDLQYLYLMAAALAVLPLASFLLAHWIGSRFTVRREHAATVQEGRVTPITLFVSATGGLPQASLQAEDDVPDGLVVREDRPEIGPLDEWDGRSGQRTYAVEPTRRGIFAFDAARVITTDPLGLFHFGMAQSAPTELVVHPTPVLARETAIGGEGMFGVRERDGRTRRGDGMDFHGVREYREGDALRRVHWPTTARTGRLSVIEFERAFQRDIIIALDLAKGSEHGEGRETTLEYAVKAAATLADRTLRAGGGVSLITQSGRVDVRPGDVDPAAGRFQLFDLLARAKADSERSLAEALQGARLETGSYLAVLTAAGDPRLSALLTVRAQRGDTVRVFFFEPSSFGGPRVSSPAVAGGELRVVDRDLSPWTDGGKRFEYLFREND